MQTKTFLALALSGLALGARHSHGKHKDGIRTTHVKVTSTYSNVETLYTTATDSLGRVTGEPTSHPPVVTSYPHSILKSMQSVQATMSNEAPSIVPGETLKPHHGGGIKTATLSHVVYHTAAVPHAAHHTSGAGGRTGGSHHSADTGSGGAGSGSRSGSSSGSSSGSKSESGDGGNGAQANTFRTGTLLAAGVVALALA